MPKFSFEAIGTQWVIDVYDAVPDEASLLNLIRARIEKFDSDYSRFRRDSLISQMAQQSGVYSLPEDAPPLFDLYFKLYELTNGQVTPLVGNVMEQAGYDANYSLVPAALTPAPEWEHAIKLDYPSIEILQPAVLDFGAAGKGYLVDIITELISQNGVKNFCVDAGGDIVCRSEVNKPMQVALENPFDVTQAIGVAQISNGALCGSAGNRRKWAEFTHIINPQTLKSPQEVVATWVAPKSGLEADGLATALFFTSAETLQSEFSFEYLIMYSDSSILKSENFPAEIFYQ